MEEKKTYDFEYSVTVNITDDVEVISYNSPYPITRDLQSIDDVKYAIKEVKILGDKKGKFEINFLCKFIENEDGTFDQVFKLLEEKEL